MTVDRAFRFVHPDLDGNIMRSGLQRDNLRGGVALAEGIRAVRQSIFILLTTIPGERVMRPEYGCNLFKLIFAPNDATTAGLAIFYVRRAIERFEPRAEILELDANADPDLHNRLNIRLIYRVRLSLETDEVTVPLDLQG